MPLFKKLALTWSVARDLFTPGTAARTRSRRAPLAPTRCAKARTTDVLARPRRQKNDGALQQEEHGEDPQRGKNPTRMRETPHGFTAVEPGGGTAIKR